MNADYLKQFIGKEVDIHLCERHFRPSPSRRGNGIHVKLTGFVEGWGASWLVAEYDTDDGLESMKALYSVAHVRGIWLASPGPKSRTR